MNDDAILLEILLDGLPGVAADMADDLGMDLAAAWLRQEGRMPPLGPQGVRNPPPTHDMFNTFELHTHRYSTGECRDLDLVRGVGWCHGLAAMAGNFNGQGSDECTNYMFQEVDGDEVFCYSTIFTRSYGYRPRLGDGREWIDGDSARSKFPAKEYW